MDGSGYGRFKRRDRAEGAAQLGLRLRGVQLGATAGVQARGGEVQRFLLVLDVATCDVELSLLAAQLEIRTGDFRDDGDLRVMQTGFRRAQIGVLRFDVATDAAEEVELPHGVETGVVVLQLLN